jgi:flavodoxin
MAERKKHALIVYSTRTGHTADAAHYVAEGLEAAGVETNVVTAEEAEPDDVEGCDVVAVGSPCHAGSMPLAGGVCVPVQSWLDAVADGALEGVVAGAFSPYSTAGGNRTVHTLDEMLRDRGAQVPCPGVAVKAGIPFSLWRGPEIDRRGAGRLRDLGRDMAAELEKDEE